MLKRLLFALLVALIPTQGWGQATVLQGGSFTAGTVPMYSSSGGSQPIVQQSGPAGGGPLGMGLRELNITARGSGNPPFAGQGTGVLGTLFQIQDAPTTNAGGFHALSFSANDGTGGLISYNAIGAAAQLPLRMNINGQYYVFPFVLSGVVGPISSVVGDGACWNNTAGTLLSDCGPPPANVVTYGADKTGAADSTAAFNAALAANKYVRVPAGTYKLSSAVSVPANTALSLEAATLNICAPITVNNFGSMAGTPQAMQQATSQTNSYVFQTNGCNVTHMIILAGQNSTLRDVVVDGNKTNNTGAGSNVYYTGNRVSINFVTSQNSNSHGVEAFSSGTDNGACCAKILDVMSLSNTGSGFKLGGSADTFIAQSEFENNGAYGVDADNSPTIRIVNSDFGGNQIGFYAHGAQFNPGVSLGSNNHIITTSQFGNNFTNDILLDGTNVGTFNNLVTGNSFFPSSNRTPATYAAVKILDNANGGNNINGNHFFASDPFTLKYGVEVDETMSGLEAWDNITDNVFNGVFTTACFKLTGKTYAGQNNCYTVPTGGSVALLNLNHLAINTQDTSNAVTITVPIQFDGIYMHNASNFIAGLSGFNSDNDGGTLGLAVGGTVKITLNSTTGSYVNAGGLAIGNTNQTLPPGHIQLAAVATSTLATCNSGSKGAYATVSDANTFILGAVVAGSGSNNIAAFCNGSNWIVASAPAILAAPALSTCGSSPVIGASSTNMAGAFTMGTGSPTACTVTFATPYPSTAACAISAASTGTASISGGYSVTTQDNSHFIVTLGTGTSGAVFNYVCNGK